MKDEADKVTIDAFEGERNAALHAEAAEKGLTPWQLMSNRVWARNALVATSYHQAVKPLKVTGRRFKGSKTPDSIRPNWRTPEHIYQWLDLMYGPFEIDLAACEKSAKCDAYFCKEENSLDQDWSVYDRMFLNPPYDDIKPWVLKSDNIHDTALLAMVLPNDNSTVWFRWAVDRARDIINITSNGKNTGRLAFINAATGKPGNENNKGTVCFIIGPVRKSGPRTIYIDQDQMRRELGILVDGD